MFRRLRCLLRGHAYTEWSAWNHAGRSRYYRERFCNRCEHHDIEED